MRLQLGGRSRAIGRQRRHRPARHFAEQGRHHSRQILVGQQTEHRQTLAGQRLGRQSPRQVFSSMGIMPNIQQQREWLTLPIQRSAIQATRNPRTRKGPGNLFDSPGQIKQSIGLQGQRGVLHRQIEQRQPLKAEAFTLVVQAGPGPALPIDAQVVIATTQEKRRIQQRHLLQQSLRRIEITAQSRRACAKDTGLLESHGFTGIAQPVGMIDTDTGDQGKIGIDQVDRIQAPAQPHFQHHGIQGRALKQPKGRQGAHLEIGQGNLATRSFDRSEGLAQFGVAGFDAGNLYTFVVTQQVR
ncbi:hypothetical protein D9M68_641050 [compost metagenome]